ncbi:hypothetical protein C7401_12598 [Paraburkholderia unamae]|uniref:DUF1269 domain-containing protein n=1 Tax=Paraburkholderia unamae TaxID=219649 RepID=UPI000DC489A6|nr:DUF1269 domain-containing protein [Paraburkholderia unamae]RAR54267.1 hypothetical protein C7401_12598 [Paraburkholderia unamae]
MNQEIDHAVLSVFTDHNDADDAIRKLAASGFDMEKLSVIGKGYHSEEHAVGFYSTGDRIRTWGTTGAVWGGIWGLLVGPALFLVPGVGVVAMAGPFVATLLTAIEGALIGGGISAVGAALAQLGLPKDQAIKYESALKADGFLLIVHGTQDDIAQAHSILGNVAPPASEASVPAHSAT